MSDTGFSVDQNPGRWLVGTGGAVLCEAGVQAMLTSQTTPILISGGITAFGFLAILIAVFWSKWGLQKTLFFQRLNQIASHPGLWIALAVTIWLSTQIVAATKEVRLNNRNCCPTK